MFDINCLSLKESNNNVLSTVSSLDENYFDSSLKYTLESQNNMIELNRELYKGILESGSDKVLVNESFMTFAVGGVKLIEKFLKFVKNLWDKFITALFKVNKNADFILKNRANIDKFNSDCEFLCEDYIYSINEIVPIIDAKAVFQEELMNLDASTLDDSLSNDEKLSELKEKYNLFKDKVNEDYYDSVRASVLGKTGEKISKANYSGELFKIYRSNKSDKVEFTVKKNNVDNAFVFVKNYKDTLGTVEDTKKQIEEQYNSIKEYMKTLLNVKKDGDNSKVSIDLHDGVNGDISKVYTMNVETIKYFNMFMTAKVKQIEQYSSIHLQAFTAKIEAFKECYNSSKKICYTALEAVHKLKL